MNKLSLAVAVAAGFVGGTFSHYMAPSPVRAETQPAVPIEVRARSFVLVNEAGSVIGTFKADSRGRPAIRLLDSTGREVWSAEGPTLRTSAGR